MTTEGTAAIKLPELPEEQPRQEQVALTIVEQAKALIISNQPELEVARDFVKQINERIKFVVEHHKPIKDAAYAAHKVAVAQEKKVLDPLEEAKKTVTKTANDYIQEQERLAAIERKRLEDEAAKERQKRMDAAQRKVGAILGKAGADSDHLEALRLELEDPETTEEEASVIRSQIAILEAKIAGHQQRAEEIRRQAEAAAAAPPPVSAPAVSTQKTAGVVGRKEVTVEVVDIKALCRGVADGILPPGVVEGVNKTLVSLARAGMNLSQFGCKVSTDTKTHFR